MYTIKYKGLFIHGYFDKGAVKVYHEAFKRTKADQVPLKWYKSLHAAKCGITKLLRGV